MSFPKAERAINEVSNYNPPPGYYSAKSSSFEKLQAQELNPTFTRDQRFKDNNIKETQQTPGPGHYHLKKQTKKRILEESRKKQQRKGGKEDSNFKINSIPSIPKQSTSRVYEELAPGLLVLHESETENVVVGPGTYDPKIVAKKAPAYRFNPQHTKKFIDLIPESNLELDAFQKPDHEKKVFTKQNLVKPIKPVVNPTDLCLELIILREKQLKPADVPPPGYYYNEKAMTSFKVDEKPIDFQYLAGRAQRFQRIVDDPVGPGKYDVGMVYNSAGGYMSKASRKNHEGLDFRAIVPGPGSYQVAESQKEIEQPKSKYPPIFGSGAQRFYSSSRKQEQTMSSTPGPGSYEIGKNHRRKRPKTINIRNPEYSLQDYPENIKTYKENSNQSQNLMISPENMNIDTLLIHKGAKQRNNTINLSATAAFKSGQKRFAEDRNSAAPEVGPGSYEVVAKSSKNTTFNKKKTVIDREPRFNNNAVRPKIGPGYYDVNDDLVKERKIYDISIS